MKIDITQANNRKGEAFAFTVSGKLNDQVIPYYNGRFAQEVVFEGEVVAFDKLIELDGIVKFKILCNCDKCNAPIARDFELDISEDFHLNEAPFGEYAYKGNILEPDKAIEDAIALELPSSIYCSDDCLGVCHKCGKNLNQGVCDCDK